MRLPRLLAVSDLAPATGSEFEAWCADLQEAGVDSLQLRAKRLSDAEQFALALRARRAFPAPGLLLINGRLDIALACEADGVHLPAAGLPIAAVRAAAPGQFLVGRSTHGLDEIAAARAAGADYALFGPIYLTPSKADKIEPLGLAALRDATHLGLPIIAIGGVAAGNVAELLSTGAAGVAAIRAFASRRLALELVEAADSAAAREEHS